MGQVYFGEITMNRLNQRKTIAKLSDWNDEQIEAVVKLDELHKKYNSLPRKESFSGWELIDKIEVQEAIVDKLNCPDFDLPKYISVKTIRGILDLKQQEVFLDELSKLLTPGSREILDYLETTQAQHLEAFLKTLNLWE